ncbi:histone-lysine N-methyltransferase NSD2 [Copidosoma floridanum]|uniref:histone-lysine N-methyltransferase NSD2 n=1 Tax=Copidosoma floridanum TaxID=29053 RepID=UPI0006C95D18|nr:histone-lysine N-methyltransferase NSD2 [Copidosoma floridanum]
MEDTSCTDSCSLDSTIKTEVEILDYEELKRRCSWSLGSIVWARFGQYPFWPSVVTLEPETRTYVAQKGSKSKYKYCQVHVRFCADKGRHNWVSSANLITFEGLAEFEKIGKEITSETKKKEPKYAAAFVIKPSIKLQWDDAVNEAIRLKSLSVEEINEIFHPDYKRKKLLNKSLSLLLEDDKTRKSLLNGSFTDDDNVKKKRKISINDIVPKKFKANGESQETNGNINLETPPTPPSSHKDSSDEGSTVKTGKDRQLAVEGIFEIFCERERESAEKLDPNANENNIREYLKKMWDLMSLQDRNKYRADYLEDEEVKFYGIEREEDEEEDDEVYSEADKSVGRSRTKNDVEETTSIESESLEKLVRKRKPKRRNSSDRDDAVSVESGEKPVKKRKYKHDDQDSSSLLQEAAKRVRPYKLLFKGFKNERVCQICEKPGKLIRCRGPCFSYFHPACVKPGESSPEPSEAGDLENLKAICGNDAYNEDLREIKEKLRENKQQQRETEEGEKTEDENFKCIDCLSAIAPACFVCHERDGERIKCSVHACGKHYHMQCLKAWPQSHWQGGRLTCPYHMCHICISDNPQNGHPRSNYERFARCVRCPSTYHASISCLPAGSCILTGSQIICPKHYESAQPPVNATWCFLCTKGGSLICCDTCPMSFHVECLGIDTPEGGFICEDCETGRLPLYGEVVWVKHGNYRWWPSIICYPGEIPPIVAQKSHKTGEFCVMFLGTRDYNWVHRGKVFLFQEGDANAKVIGNKKVEDSYRRAMEEAKVFHKYLMCEKAMAKAAAEKRNSGSHRHLKPPHYVKLRVNKPVGNVKILQPDSIVACNCDPNKPNPCSLESDCLNRILMIECSPDACPAGTACQNQMFVQRKYPNMKPFHTDERGWGLKVLESVKEGQFVIEYVGEVIDEAEYRLRLEQKKERKNENYYFLTIDNSRMIDAEPKGNLSRFMNHSCMPNCETQKWTVNGDTRIGLFALRDIEPGDELTFNYNLACDGETKKPCLCKAPNCSGFIGLKVPKQTISIAQQKNIEKAEKVKKQRKYKRVLMCWNCNLKIDNANEAFKCDQKTCGKYYHPHCIAIEDGPDQTFHCPWHFCAECYKRTSIRCSYCCNAFCQPHTYGNLREHPENGTLVCYNHPAELTECYDMDVGEALMDDDGETDDDVVITYENYMVNCGFESGQVSELLSTSSKVSSLSIPALDIPVTATTPVSVDERSPRGAIVEIQPSSEDDDNEQQASSEGSTNDGGKVDASTSAKLRKRRKRVTGSGKKSTVDENFTVDQIAAIIGIIK